MWLRRARTTRPRAARARLDLRSPPCRGPCKAGVHSPRTHGVKSRAPSRRRPVQPERRAARNPRPARDAPGAAVAARRCEEGCGGACMCMTGHVPTGHAFARPCRRPRRGCAPVMRTPETSPGGGAVAAAHAACSPSTPSWLLLPRGTPTRTGPRCERTTAYESIAALPREVWPDSEDGAGHRDAAARRGVLLLFIVLLVCSSAALGGYVLALFPALQPALEVRPPFCSEMVARRGS